MVVLLFISFVFLATTMDSSAFAAAEMPAVQTGSDDLAPRWLRLVWAVAAAVIAFIVVQLSGAQAVRSVCYIAGLPLALIVFLIMYSVFIMLREDYVRHSAIPFFTDYDLGKKNGWLTAAYMRQDSSSREQTAPASPTRSRAERIPQQESRQAQPRTLQKPSKPTIHSPVAMF